MKTNQNRHTLRNLTNRVIAVIDDPRHTQAAVETLERAGIAERDLATFSGEEGARQIDAEGVHSGGVTHVLRGLQRWTVEGAHLRKYQSELTQGHQVVDVHMHGRRGRDAVARILRAHGAHFINAYGQWTIEGIAA
jgi:hypothetical protein